MRYEKNNTVLHQSAVEFVDYCRTIKGLTEDTLRGYESDLKLFCDFIKPAKKNNITDRFIKTIKLQDLHRFMSYLEKECKNSVVTRSRKVSTLKAYFEYLQNVLELITSNPAYSLQKPKLPKKKPVAMSIEECKKLLESLDENSQFYLRDKCILMIFLQCGLRLSELVNIKFSDIKGNRIIINGKGSKERYAYLSDSCMKALNEYLEVRENENASRQDKEYLFLSQRQQQIGDSTVQAMIKKHMENAGLDTSIYHTHTTRHTFATIAYNQGADAIKLSELLGHTNVNTSKIYITLRDEDLEEITNKNPLNNL
jgi:site-specific recombinase XerD